MATSSFALSACCSLNCDDEPFHLVLKRFPVVLLGFRTDIAAGGQHMAVLAHLIQCLRLCRSRARRRNHPYLLRPARHGMYRRYG